MKKVAAIGLLFFGFSITSMQSHKELLDFFQAKVYEQLDPVVVEYCKKFKNTKSNIVARYAHFVALKACGRCVNIADPDRALEWALNTTPANRHEWYAIKNETCCKPNNRIENGKLFFESKLEPIKGWMKLELEDTCES